jgi:hypothetical protein
LRSGSDTDDNLDDINALAGSNDLFNHNPANIWFDYGRHVDAAFVLGLALGHLVSPDAFKTGGAR